MIRRRAGYTSIDAIGAVNWLAPFNRGLVCWHKLLPGQRGGPVFRNLCHVYKNQGTLTNMDPITDWVDNTHRGGSGSIETDGSDDRVIFGTPQGLNGAEHASFSAWIYRSSTGTTVGLGGPAGSTITGANRWSIIWFSDSNIYLNVPSSGGNGRFGSSGLSGTGWHWIYVQFIGDGGSDAGRNKLWVDGVARTLSFGGTGTGQTAIGTVTPWEVGRDSSNRFCGGGYDDIRLSLGRGAIFSDLEVKRMYREVLENYPNLLRRRRVTVMAPEAAAAAVYARFLSLLGCGA